MRADVPPVTCGLSVGQGDTVKDVLAPQARCASTPSPWRRGASSAWAPWRIPRSSACRGPRERADLHCCCPVLRQIAGRRNLHRSSMPVSISSGWHSLAGKREFVPVHLTGSPSRGYAAPTSPWPARPGCSAWREPNAIAVVPETTHTVVAGDTLHCLLLNPGRAARSHEGRDPRPVATAAVRLADDADRSGGRRARARPKARGGEGCVRSGAPDQQAWHALRLADDARLSPWESHSARGQPRDPALPSRRTCGTRTGWRARRPCPSPSRSMACSPGR